MNQHLLLEIYVKGVKQKVLNVNKKYIINYVMKNFKYKDCHLNNNAKKSSYCIIKVLINTH